MKTLEEMKRRLKEIEDHGSHWKKLGDGNYDLYLIDNGYKQLEETFKEISELLAQPDTEQEPVATKLESHQFTAFRVSADDFKKLQKLPTGTKIYTSPPKREPLSEDVVWDNLPENPMECSAFIRGVKFAEKAHGIGVDDDR